jgi:hypothetical protein
MKRVKELQESLSAGNGLPDDVEINDLASLLKSWYGSLPEPLITKQMTPDLEAALEGGDVVTWATGLPELVRVTLMYLVGFLRRMAQSSEVTKMVPTNLAICFAPNLIDITGSADPRKAAKLSECAQVMLVKLIESWEVTEIYPPLPIMTERIE